MKLSKSAVLLLSTLALLTACGSDNSSAPVSSVGQSQEQSQVDPQAPVAEVAEPQVQIKNGVKFSSSRLVELKADFSNIASVKENLNTFKIDVELQKAQEDTVSVKCFKVGDRNPLIEESISMGEKTGETMEIKLALGDSLLNVNCLVSLDGEEISSGVFSFNRSLLIDGVVAFKSLTLTKLDNVYTLDRLILTDRSTLLVEDEVINLVVDRIYANNAFIQTFKTEEKVGKYNADAKNGGEVTINAKESFGHLTVRMFGTDGDNQRLTPKAKEQTFPIVDSNRNAIADWNTYEQECTSQSKSLDIPLDPMRGPSEHCIKVPVPHKGRAASNGPDGIDGERGFPGHIGGNSGKLTYTTVNSHEDFTINIISEGGKGGLGGAGGLECKAGQGGAGAGSYPAGANGRASKAGDVGPTGAAGKEEASCFSSTVKGINKCSK